MNVQIGIPAGWKRLCHVLGLLVPLAMVGYGSANVALALPPEAGYPLVVQTTVCSEPPPNPPTFAGSDCTPAVGVEIEVYEVGGRQEGSCTTHATSQSDHVALCTTIVPYDTQVAIYEVDSTVPAGYAPVHEPLYDTIPAMDAGPPDGEDLPPIFINLPVEDDGDLVDQLVQVLIDILDSILNGTPHQV